MRNYYHYNNLTTCLRVRSWSTIHHVIEVRLQCKEHLFLNAINFKQIWMAGSWNVQNENANHPLMPGEPPELTVQTAQES